MPSHDSWWRKWRFGFLLASLLIGYEIASAILLIKLTPPGQQWLGPLFFNHADHAVYLNYLFQGKDHFLISNLYNDEPQTPRFDAFWSIGGLLVRVGLSPILAHEILRWLCTLALAFAIYATAKALTNNERRARLASCLMLGGMSLGSLYAAWEDMGGPVIKTAAPTPPDIVTEFGTAPIFTGGAHIILSVALELLVVRWLYELICLRKNKLLLPTVLVIVYFVWLHPYFIALVGCQIIICLLAVWKNDFRRQALLSSFVACLALLPATIYYVWLALADAAFKTHHLEINRLELGSIWIWLITLAPLIWAASRIWLNKVPRDYEPPRMPCWLWAWLLSAFICVILPFPWKRKYTQGLLIALVALTLPYWLMVSEWLLSRWKTGVKYLVSFFLFVLFVFNSYLYIFQIQFQVSKKSFASHFYQTTDLIAAWTKLQTIPADSLIMTDDAWVNLWTPAETGRHIWIGHSHETPDYQNRLRHYVEWRLTNDPLVFNRVLDDNRITYIIVTNPTNEAKYETLIDRTRWSIDFKQGQVTVWMKE